MVVSTWEMTRYNAYRWRCELSLTKKIALAVGMACIIGLAAQIRFYFPWTPVPITAQTFAVLLAGVLLGRWWGGTSVAIYAGLGAAGLPWFAGWAGGAGYLAGPTGGYIVGFILAALFIGHFTDKYVKTRSFLGMLGVMLFANLVLIYIPGLLQLNLWLSLVKGEAIGFYQVLVMGALPFIAGDVVKIVAAAATARVITPRQPYNRAAETSSKRTDIG